MKKNALLFGMSLDEFWYGNPQDFYVYAEVYKTQQEQQAQYLDYMAWRTGFYTMLGTMQCLQYKSTKKIFPDEPYSAKEVKNKGLSLQEKIMAGAKRHNEIMKARREMLQGDNNG